ncbi:MAG: sugar ABC transporter ATP-binding protein, partial [Parvibaculaceae bacterium]
MPEQAEDLLRVEELTKTFSGTTALDAVSFALRQGEIHALIGENGAGKSTLIKILTGIYRPDRGRFLSDGEPAEPGLAALSISVVHQDMGLVGDMTVAENIALVAGYARRGGLIDWQATRGHARAILHRLDSAIDPDAQVGALTTAEKALVAIARALSVPCRILILDEPTAALPDADAERIATVLRRLRERRIGIIYVTHRLDELFRVADRVTVFRDGRNAGTYAIADTSIDKLVERMVGRAVSRGNPPASTIGARPLASLDDLWVEGVGPVALAVRPGEIIGLSGLAGAGHHKIARAVAGLLPLQAGRITGPDGGAIDGARRAAIRQGVAMVGSDRIGESILPDMTLQENLFPNPALFRKPFAPIDFAVEARRTSAALARFDVRPRRPERPIAALSGGNQQKVVLARWFEMDFRLLVLEEPTAAQDVGARADFDALLRQAARAGEGVLIAS